MRFYNITHQLSSFYVAYCAAFLLLINLFSPARAEDEIDKLKDGYNSNPVVRLMLCYSVTGDQYMSEIEKKSNKIATSARGNPEEYYLNSIMVLGGHGAIAATVIVECRKALEPIELKKFSASVYGEIYKYSSREFLSIAAAQDNKLLASCDGDDGNILLPTVRPELVKFGCDALRKSYPQIRSYLQK